MLDSMLQRVMYVHPAVHRPAPSRRSVPVRSLHLGAAASVSAPHHADKISRGRRTARLRDIRPGQRYVFFRRRRLWSNCCIVPVDQSAAGHSRQPTVVVAPPAHPGPPCDHEARATPLAYSWLCSRRVCCSA